MPWMVNSNLAVLFMMPLHHLQALSDMHLDSAEPKLWGSTPGHPPNRRNGARQVDLLISIFRHIVRIFFKLLRPLIASLMLGVMVLLVTLTLQRGFMTAFRILLNAPGNLMTGRWKVKD